MRKSSSTSLTPTAPLEKWSIRVKDDIVAISYGHGADHPQCAALHLKSGYFRMIYEPGAGWGTSVVLLPSFWVAGKLWQGARVSVDWSVDGSELVGVFQSRIQALQVNGELRLTPPAHERITAHVSVNVDGDVEFDHRPGEAFKPVALSSMKVSETEWDTSRAYIEFRSFEIPSKGRMTKAKDTGRTFGLTGGTSSWKKNAPTIEITLDRDMHIGGWVTRSSNHNDDNVGLWAAPDEPIRSWSYHITAKP